MTPMLLNAKLVLESLEQVRALVGPPDIQFQNSAEVSQAVKIWLSFSRHSKITATKEQTENFKIHKTGHITNFYHLN